MKQKKPHPFHLTVSRLSKRKEEFYPLLLNSDRKIRKKARDYLNRTDPSWPESEDAQKLVPELISSLADGEVREDIGEILSQIDPGWFHREEARGQTRLFILALKHWDWTVRAEAVKTLGLIDDKRAVGALVSALGDTHGFVRASAEDILNRIAPSWPESEDAKSQVPVFVNRLNDRDWVMRMVAARILGMIRDNRAVEPLLRVLDDTHGQVRKTVEDVLNRIDPSWRLGNQAKSQVPLLVNAVKYRNTDGQKRAANILQLISEPFIGKYPSLFCSKCLRRAVKMRKVFSYEIFEYVCCPSCHSVTHLLSGFDRILGVVGNETKQIGQKDGALEIRVWNEKEKTARAAETDMLVIRSGLENYHRALNAVVIEFRAAFTNQRKIPIRIEGPYLSKGILSMLADFGEIVD